MIFTPGALRGTIRVPGDKSISHRALILAASGSEPVTIRNLNPGRDVSATASALAAMRVMLRQASDDTVIVNGTLLHDPQNALDCMNSGSTARMLMGVCTGANLRARLDGDDSLRRRPMEPVAAQLRAFGARIETTSGTLPANVQGTSHAETRNFILLAPSAQVKTALLLAGVFGRVAVTIAGDQGSRDHTERLLRYWGANVESDREHVELRSFPQSFEQVDVVGDFSAAAFFIVAATVAAGSSLRIDGVGINPSRTGLLDALQAMGANVRLENVREQSGEPIGDICVESAVLRGVSIGPDVALRAIDEIPVLAVAAAFAQGETKITGVRDLRNKESDRIAAITRLLSAAGIEVQALPGGVAIGGGNPRASGSTVATHGDHRTAMAAAVLAAGAGELAIDDDESIDVSFPKFNDVLRKAQVPA